MNVDVDTTETHVVSYMGKLTGEQFKALILDAIRRHICPSLPYQGNAIELTIGERLMETVWPDVGFEIKHDKRWVFKPDDRTSD